VTETEWAPPLPDAWSLDDVFAGCEPSATPTRELVTSPDRDLVADLWSADARMAREVANLYVAVESLARRRPADADRPAGTPGAPGVDSRALAAPRLGGVSEAFVPELAMIRSCTETEATTLALEAVALVRHLPETLQALREGRCDQRRARALVELLSPASRAAAGRVQAAVLPTIEHRSVAQLRATVRRLLARWEAEALEARQRERAARVDARVRPVGDGMSEFVVDLEAPVAAACADACDQYAQQLRAGGDQRPIGVLRAQVAADLLLRPWDARPPVTANITVYAQLCGLTPTGHAPADVSGQVVTAGQCRELLARLDALGLRAPEGGSLQVAVTDDTGRLVAVADRCALERGAGGRPNRRRAPSTQEAEPAGPGLRPPPRTGGYTPTAAQRRFVQVRDRTCRMPGCRRRAGRCDIDHDAPWHAGGATDVCNLVCLCRRHHRLKTHAPGWSFRLLPDGRLRVRTPSGVVRTTWPPGQLAAPEPPAATAAPERPDQPPF